MVVAKPVDGIVSAVETLRVVNFVPFVSAVCELDYLAAVTPAEKILHNGFRELVRTKPEQNPIASVRRNGVRFIGRRRNLVANRTTVLCVLVVKVFGSTINWFENLGFFSNCRTNYYVEETAGHCRSGSVVYHTNCWGKLHDYFRAAMVRESIGRFM